MTIEQAEKLIEKNPEFYYSNYRDKNGNEHKVIRPKEKHKLQTYLRYYKNTKQEPDKLFERICNLIEIYNSIFPSVSEKLALTLLSQIKPIDEKINNDFGTIKVDNEKIIFNDKYLQTARIPINENEAKINYQP